MKKQKSIISTIPTNRFVCKINYEAFLRRFRLFRINIMCEDIKHRSVYDKLTSLISEDICLSVAYNYVRKTDVGIQKEYFLLTPLSNTINSRIIKREINDIGLDCEALELNLGERFPENAKLANILLSYLPNLDASVSYADGKFYLGRCLDWAKHHEEFGELIFLNIWFSNISSEIISMNSSATTFTKEQMYSGKELAQVKRKRPFYVSYSDSSANVYASRLPSGNMDVYYHDMTRVRDNEHNTIPFLNVKDMHGIKTSQARSLLSVVDLMRTHYGDFLELEQVCYEGLNQVLDNKIIKLEDKYILDFVSNAKLFVDVFDKNDTYSVKVGDYVRQILLEEALIEGATINLVDTAKDATAVLRILPSLKFEDRSLRGKSKEEVFEFKRKYHLHKSEYFKTGIPVQDITSDSIQSRKTLLKRDIPPVKALLRQLCIKGMCLNNTLPSNVASRCANSTILYAEQNDSKSYDTIIAHFDAVGNPYDVRYESLSADRGYISFNNISVPVRIKGEYQSQRRIYFSRHNNIDIQIFDTEDFVFPNCNYIIDKLQSGCAPHILKRKDERPHSYGAYVDINYWQIDDCHWCYSAGLRGRELNGTKTDFPHKTHIRHIVSSQTIARKSIESILIRSLEDGWLRKNNNSVHPAIYKFMKEYLEILRTKRIAQCGNVIGLNL